MLGQRPDRERQAPVIQLMVLGERRPLGGWRRPHRRVHLLGQGDGLAPARSPGHGRAEDQHRPLRGGDRVGEKPQPGWIGADAGGRAAHDRRAEGRDLPVIERQREEDRTRRRLDRGGVGPHERAGDVLRPGRLVGPFDPGPGLNLWLDVGQPGFEQQHPAVLLPGRDDQRRFVQEDGHQVALGVAKPGRGVHVHQRRGPCRLGEAVRYRDDRRLLQSQDETEVVREILQECLLRRSRIAEHGGEPEVAKQPECRLADTQHLV